MSVKKQSLFKQKLKQSKMMQQKNQDKKQQPSIHESFPKVFKIDKFDISENYHPKISSQTYKPEAMIDESQVGPEEIQQLTYLKVNQQQIKGFISQDELNQINNENWNAVNSMSQEQRKNYINLIQNTLPKHFINKLRKNKSNLQQNQAKILKTSLMVPEITKTNLNQQLKVKSEDNEQKHGIINQQEEVDEEIQEHKDIIDQIHLNIKNGKLVYLQENVLLTLSEDQKIQRINRNKIYEMLTAQNNQSQIIASQLTLTWFKNIFPSENIVFHVSNIPFHTKIMLSEMYHLLKKIEANIKSTKFYSCYIQMIVKSVQILSIIFKNLSDQQLSQQYKFIEEEFQKTQKSLKQLLNNKIQINKQQNNQLQSKEMLFESLGIIYQSLNEENDLRIENSKAGLLQVIDLEEKIQKIKSQNKINDLIQAILIEQTFKKEDFNKYDIFPSINNFLQTIISYWQNTIKKNLQNLPQKLVQVNNFYNLIYTLVCNLNKKQRGFPFYKGLVKNIYLSLLHVIEQNYLKRVLQQFLSQKFVDILNSNKNKSIMQLKKSIIFKILFIYRELSRDTDKFASFLQNSKKDWIISEDEALIIVYVNFIHYTHAQELKKEEIETLQKMLQWLTKQLGKKQVKETFLNSEEVLISLLSLFLSSEQQIYSLLDQNLLQQVFKQAVNLYESSSKKQTQILSQTSIKKMTQNYNFNSFGNDIFTRVIFWVAVSVNAQIEAFIAEEIMMRYPMLFYYACEPIHKESIQQNKNNQFQNKQSSSPLLGDIEQYIKSTNISKNHFTYSSNESIKVNILKLLNMNLEFSTSSNIEIQTVQKILNNVSVQQREGFFMNRNKLNPQNFFYKYLINPFLKQIKYKQLF